MAPTLLPAPRVVTPFSVRLRLLAAGVAVPPAAEPAVLVVLVVVLVDILGRWEVVKQVHLSKAMLAERAAATEAVAAVALVLQVLVAPLEMAGSGCSLRLLA